jgi:Uma2 family endonuclease
VLAKAALEGELLADAETLPLAVGAATTGATLGALTSIIAAATHFTTANEIDRSARPRRIEPPVAPPRLSVTRGTTRRRPDSSRAQPMPHPRRRPHVDPLLRSDAMATSFAPPAREMTIDEWADLDEDVEGELVDGVLVEEEVTDYEHETLISYLQRALYDWARRGGGHVFGSEAKVAISRRRGRKPDLTVFLPPNVPRPKDKITRVPPTIAVEVISNDRARDVRRDRVEKLREYASIGVASYWLVDPAIRALEVLRLGTDGCYVVALVVVEGAHAIPGCEGLVVDVDAMWRAVDALGEPAAPATDVDRDER